MAHAQTLPPSHKGSGSETRNKANDHSNMVRNLYHLCLELSLAALVPVTWLYLHECLHDQLALFPGHPLGLGTRLVLSSLLIFNRLCWGSSAGDFTGGHGIRNGLHVYVEELQE